MGLKGYRLWVMGQLDSNMQSPTAAAASRVEAFIAVLRGRDCASESREFLGRKDGGVDGTPRGVVVGERGVGFAD